MKLPVDTCLMEKLLREAVDMLKNVQHHLSTIQRRYDGKLKEGFHRHESLKENLQVRLSEISTGEQNAGGDLCCG
ncbi:hypothetical protein [Mucilaginibacter sp.]|uniref:hypothetical protein n=1 Tax=Mucilaginibacter sp. TaxID=1882438 RepID=UPI003D0D743D